MCHDVSMQRANVTVSLKFKGTAVLCVHVFIRLMLCIALVILYDDECSGVVMWGMHTAHPGA